MLARDIRKLKNEEIEDRLGEVQKEMFSLRRDKASGRLEDHNKIQALKREIARFRTILRERELSAELSEGGESR